MKPDVVAPGTHITGASPQHARLHRRRRLRPGLRRQRVLLARVRAPRRRRRTCPARPRCSATGTCATRRPAAALAGDDEGNAREHARPTSTAATAARAARSRPCRTRTRAGAAWTWAPRSTAPSASTSTRTRRPRRDRPERPPLLLGRRHGQAGPRHARLDRPAAGHRHRQRVRERPRPRGERGRADLPRQLDGRRPLDPGRPGRLPQQRRERGAARRHGRPDVREGRGEDARRRRRARATASRSTRTSRSSSRTRRSRPRRRCSCRAA